MTRFAYSLLLLLFITLSTPQAFAAQSLDSAVQDIKQQTGGRILSAKTIKKNGTPVHHIKVLLPSGKVRIFKVK